MAAPSGNQQAMLTTEPLSSDTTTDVLVIARTSAQFDYLTSSDTDADNADLFPTHRWAWYCKDPTCPQYWSAWSCKSNFWLHLFETEVHRADLRTHTRVGRRNLAREWRVKTDWEMTEPKQPKPTSHGTNGTTTSNE
ncbi:hypothetical protein FHL15_002800 [Xylaria flabelliformis]|uniref:Uncharacterized protein n=1 Tax=Xylaria flabelliformis TaxID=2512241 RepID=A0A553I8J8_9PEZI|nr:hypothetical protein FHL15_002800 [Xylaria flabelliformis]